MDDLQTDEESTDDQSAETKFDEVIESIQLHSLEEMAQEGGVADWHVVATKSHGHGIRN